jgi:hypothetical protein
MSYNRILDTGFMILQKHHVTREFKHQFQVAQIGFDCEN